MICKQLSSPLPPQAHLGREVESQTSTSRPKYTLLSIQWAKHNYKYLYLKIRCVRKLYEESALTEV